MSPCTENVPPMWPQNDLKRALGLYRDINAGEGIDAGANRANQKAWAKMRGRMESAGLIETVIALVDGRQTTCVRCDLHRAVTLHHDQLIHCVSRGGDVVRE